VLRSVAAWGLPGAPPFRPPGAMTMGRDLVESAAAEHLLGPMVAAVDAGALELKPAVREALFERHRRALVWCLQVERRLDDVARWFAAGGGVDHLVVKGPAIAHLDEPDPARRTFADLDLLVQAYDLDRAVHILEGQGARRPWAERRRGHDHRFAKSVTLTFSDGIEVDLHRSLCDGVHGFRIPLDRVFDDAGSFPLAGAERPCPSLPHRALHAAYHAVLGSPRPRLSTLRDVAGYLTRPGLGPDVLLPEVTEWHGEVVLAIAVEEVQETLGIDLRAWAAWAADQPRDPAEMTIISRSRREGSSFGRGKLDALRELPWRERGAYALGLAVPSGAHLRSRGMRRRDLLRRVR
jgi:hypothetical protein